VSKQAALERDVGANTRCIRLRSAGT